MNQNASVYVQSDIRKAMEITRVLRQGCVISPLLFNLQSKKFFAKALESEAGRAPVNGIPINNLRFADDSLLLAENIQRLQSMFNSVNTASRVYSLTLIVKKTKYMVVTKASLRQPVYPLRNSRSCSVNAISLWRSECDQPVFIFSLLQGAETWTLNKLCERKLQAFEMCVWRSYKNLETEN